MAKRGSIVENMRVSKAAPPSRTSNEGWASTSVHLPVELLALEDGGRQAGLEAGRQAQCVGDRARGA